MAFTKYMFVVLLLMCSPSLLTSQSKLDSSELHDESDENVLDLRGQSEKDINLKLLGMTEKSNVGELATDLLDKFVKETTDEINAIDKDVREHKDNLILTAFQLLTKRLIGSAQLLEQSKCSPQLEKKLKDYMQESRGYIKYCASMKEVLVIFRDWVKVTLEILKDLKVKLNMDMSHCKKQDEWKMNDCFLQLFHFYEDRKIEFKSKHLQKLKGEADRVIDNVDEKWFMCTLRCTSAAKKVNTILEKIFELDAEDESSNCAVFTGVISSTFKIRPLDSGLEPYFREIKRASLDEIESPYQTYAMNF